MESLFSVKQFVDKFKEMMKKLCMVFVYLVKTSDRMPREGLIRVLIKKEVSKAYINVTKYMHEGLCTSFKSICIKIEHYRVRV